VQGATSAERWLCPEKLICLGLFVGPALSTGGLVILWSPMEVLGPTALQHRVVARRSRSYMLG